MLLPSILLPSTFREALQLGGLRCVQTEDFSRRTQASQALVPLPHIPGGGCASLKAQKTEDI